MQGLAEGLASYCIHKNEHHGYCSCYIESRRLDKLEKTDLDDRLAESIWFVVFGQLDWWCGWQSLGITWADLATDELLQFQLRS